MPQGKRVVLGLVTTKRGELEDKDDAEAADRRGGAVRRRWISCACRRSAGSPPPWRATPLTHDEQVAKLAPGRRDGARGLGLRARSVNDSRQAIRDLVENWVVWRDAGDWERFRTVWHEDGRMMATWFQGPADEFIRVSSEGFDRGVRILHFLGGTSIDVEGDRADRADQDDDLTARRRA